MVAREGFLKLRNFTLMADSRDHLDETQHPTDLTPRMTDEYDAFNKLVRCLAILPQLTTLHLTGSHVITATFFQDLPPFPVLADFQLDFASSTADGKWLFVEDRGLMDKIQELEEQQSVHYYDSDSNQSEPVELWNSDDEDGPLLLRQDWMKAYRTMPDPELIPVLLKDAARMVASCKHLRKFIIRHRHNANRERITWDHTEIIAYGRNLEVWYVRSGTSCDHANKVIPADRSFVDIDRMYWRVGERWRPDASIVDAWQSAVGSEVLYCYLKDYTTSAAIV